MYPKILLDEFDEEIIRAFVNRNADYYINKWKEMALTGSKISWNWAAFLFQGGWMLYRRMYLYYIVFSLLSMFALSMWVIIIGLFLTLGMWVGLGMYGNYLYAKFTYRKLKELEAIFDKNDKDFKKIAYNEGKATFADVAGIIFLLVMGSMIYIYILVFMILGLSAVTMGSLGSRY